MISQVKMVGDLANVTKAVNWLDGALCKIIESGRKAGFIVGYYDDIAQMAKVYADYLSGLLEDRTLPQNSKIHAMMEDIRLTGVIKIPGKRIVMADFDEDESKALLVIWFADEMALNGTPLPKPPRSIIDPISGRMVSIRPSTKDFGKKIMSEFIEWLYATGSESGVNWSEKALECYQQSRQAQ